jgi:hypothetical protein
VLTARFKNGYLNMVIQDGRSFAFSYGADKRYIRRSKAAGCIREFASSYTRVCQGAGEIKHQLQRQAGKGGFYP